MVISDNEKIEVNKHLLKTTLDKATKIAESLRKNYSTKLNKALRDLKETQKRVNQEYEQTAKAALEVLDEKAINELLEAYQSQTDHLNSIVSPEITIEDSIQSKIDNIASLVNNIETPVVTKKVEAEKPIEPDEILFEYIPKVAKAIRLFDKMTLEQKAKELGFNGDNGLSVQLLKQYEIGKANPITDKTELGKAYLKNYNNRLMDLITEYSIQFSPELAKSFRYSMSRQNNIKTDDPRATEIFFNDYDALRNSKTAAIIEDIEDGRDNLNSLSKKAKEQYLSWFKQSYNSRIGNPATTQGYNPTIFKNILKNRDFHKGQVKGITLEETAEEIIKSISNGNIENLKQYIMRCNRSEKIPTKRENIYRDPFKNWLSAHGYEPDFSTLKKDLGIEKIPERVDSYKISKSKKTTIETNNDGKNLKPYAEMIDELKNKGVYENNAQFSRLIIENVSSKSLVNVQNTLGKLAKGNIEETTPLVSSICKQLELYHKKD